MSHLRLPPPAPEDCLIQSRVSRYNGGTLIAEEVTDLETHRRWLANGDSYRPDLCPRCGGDTLHVHDYPERKPLGLAGCAVVRVVRYLCALSTCRATWRILPAFLARHLWWVWSAIEPTVVRVLPSPPVPSPPVPSSPVPSPPVPSPPVPERTKRRWTSRLDSAARQLVVLLASSGGAVLEAIAKAVGLDATRQELVAAHTTAVGSPVGQRLAEPAALVHRLERGLRLM